MVTIQALWLQLHSNLVRILLFEFTPGICWCVLEQHNPDEILLILSYHCPWGEFPQRSQLVRFLTYEKPMYGGGVLPRMYPRSAF
jgi:hypothetical protein